MIKRPGTSIYLLPILFLFLTACSDKKAFVHKQGGFSVVFNGIPSEATENVPTAYGDIAVTMLLDEVNPKKVNLVGFSDYPEKVISQNTPQGLMKNAMEGVLGNLKTNAEEEKTGEFSGHPCIDFKASGNGFYVVYKLLVVKNRLYQVGIMKQGEAVSQDEIDDFIGSFELLE